MEPALLIAVALLAVVALLWASLERVAEGQVALLSRFGRVRRVLTPGLHAVLPLIDRIERRLDMVGRSLELHDHPVGEAGHVDGRVYYQILDARQAAPELEHLEETVTRELDRLLPEFLPEHRDEPAETFNFALKQSLNARLRSRGILIARTHIQAA